MDTQPQIGAAVQLSENPNVTGYVRGYTASRGLTIVEWDSGIREKIHHSELTPNPHERDLDPSGDELFDRIVQTQQARWIAQIQRARRVLEYAEYHLEKDNTSDALILIQQAQQALDVYAHNHVTRDIKPRGECPACDLYHQRHEKRTN